MQFNKIMERMSHKYYLLCKQKQKQYNETSIQTVPSFSGVYVLYLDGNPIYVGRANKIKQRITRQHLNKNNEVSSSSLRLHLKKSFVRRFDQIRPWVLNNCTFKFVEVDNYDDSILFEALLIKKWRNKYKLLNDNKYDNNKI